MSSPEQPEGWGVERDYKTPTTYEDSEHITFPPPPM